MTTPASLPRFDELAPTSHCDALVIGAGPTGSVAAGMLRKAGLRVRMVEREQFPRFVIGESLLPRCMEAIEDAGLLDAAKACSFQQKAGAKFLRGPQICDFDFHDAFTPGWHWTWQVPRADFDLALARGAEALGAELTFRTEVVAIAFEGALPNAIAEAAEPGAPAARSRTLVRHADGREEVIEARFLLDCSGYGRVIPRMFHLDRVSGQQPRHAFFAHLEDPRRSEADEPNRIQIISHKVPGVWAWVIPFSTGITSVGFVGFPEFFADYAEGGAKARGAVQIADRYRALVDDEVHTAARFRGVPQIFEPRTLSGWSVTTDTFFGNGFVLAGNATEFLDPIFSSGVTLATTSGHRAGQLAARQLHGAPVDWQREYVEPTMMGVDTFRVYVNAWYDGTLEKIFYADNPDPEVKRRICSVLAGYAWDTQNPYVTKGERALRALRQRIEAEEAHAAPH